jgi:hypothetical protein
MAASVCDDAARRGVPQQAGATGVQQTHGEDFPMRFIHRALALALGLAMLPPAQAVNPQPDLVSSEGYLIAHPDLRWRDAGEQAYQKKRYAEAFDKFRLAARYADKPSQAMLATMLWNGEGVSRDRAQAYAWMDLAAERGYPDLLAQRERYWNELDAAERTRAVEIGQGIYAGFADDVAKPRMEKELVRYRIETTTGSHAGKGGTSRVKMFDQASGRVIELPGLIYHDPRFWDADQHWRTQDALWTRRSGTASK